MSVPVLELENLAIRFCRGRVRHSVLEGLSLRIGKGEMAALVGQSGGGKTMAALSIPRLLPRGAKISGRIRLEGTEIQDLPEPGMRRLRGRKIGVVFQDNLAALNPRLTVGAQLAEVLRLHGGMEAAAARAQAVRQLDGLGIARAAEKAGAWPHMLSGGERQRAGLALALAANPALLIADEPFAALDAGLAAEMLALLADIQRKRGLAVLMVSHDLAAMRDVADHICVLRAGKVVEQGRAGNLLAHPKAEYTARLLAACAPVRTALPPATAPLLEVKNLSVHHGAQPVLHQLSFALHRGEALAVMGPSGAGKTTLARAVLQMLPYVGSIKLAGQDLAQLKGSALRAARRRIQPLFQDPAHSLNPALSLRASLDEVWRLTGAPRLARAAQDARAVALLAQVGLEPQFLQRLPQTLSGGQVQRAALARALAANAEVLVLDEPSASLDTLARAELIEVLRAVLAAGKASILLVTHDPVLAASLASRVIRLPQGTEEPLC